MKEEQIITIELDLAKDIKFRNPLLLSSYVREKVEGSKEEFYLFVDEIQMSDEVTNPYNEGGKKITFYDALNDLRSLSNLDVYVTGSNSKMLSSDILTEFRIKSGNPAFCTLWRSQMRFRAVALRSITAARF